MNKWKLDLTPTKSSTYILPIVDMQVKFKFLDRMIGSFLFNNHKELLFCVLYSYSGKEDFTDYEKILMEHTLYEGHEDYDGYSLYKFRLTEVMQKTVDMFVTGKYSWFPEEHKDAIENFIERRGFSNAKRVRKILDKDDEIRLELEEKFGSKIDKGAELSEAPNLDREIFSERVSEIEINVKEAFNED